MFKTLKKGKKIVKYLQQKSEYFTESKIDKNFIEIMCLSLKDYLEYLQKKICKVNNKSESV